MAQANGKLAGGAAELINLSRLALGNARQYLKFERMTLQESTIRDS
jgi:hypothetical protein